MGCTTETCNAVSKGSISNPTARETLGAHRNSYRRRTGAWESAVSMSAAPHMSMRNPLIQSWFNAYALTTYVRAHGQERHKIRKGLGGAIRSGKESGEGAKGEYLELEGEGREDEGAFLLEDLADVVAGGARQRQRHRLPHLRRRRSDPTPPCAVRLRGWLAPFYFTGFFFGGVGWSRGGAGAKWRRPRGGEGWLRLVAPWRGCAFLGRALCLQVPGHVALRWSPFLCRAGCGSCRGRCWVAVDVGGDVALLLLVVGRVCATGRQGCDSTARAYSLPCSLGYSHG